ncbi:heme oxygenase-like protein [Massarina eburnea CBS 473.64]|uniref:Heme oxygenase-like protein n=1 Tax=Massarina eburnea CBS 473.64 TaxID=1395130 RepID=A0A6A6S9M9_9PLEO|nr:heme oxygenase-like protein [Massarina eburnea CBS 473.64]
MAIEKALHVELPDEINIATRTLHTELNRLITSRLPFALPPLSTDPTLYRTGLLHFAHIYLTFESLWTDLLPPSSPTGASSPPISPLLSFLLVNPYAEPELFTSPPQPHIIEFLQTLRPKGLPRSGRLKTDLQYLSGLHPTDFDVMLSQYPGDQVAEFCAHIRRRVGSKPHVLVAYAWCFYMAVFSGGRWIRGELLKAGTEFWTTSEGAEMIAEQVRLHDKGLSFWSFPGQHDGLDIKEAFKAHLKSAEALFTPEERIDIVEEAKVIFKLSANLVHELDELLGTDLARLKGSTAAESRPVAGKVTLAKSLGTWLHRPEVSGAVLALGCLACVALLRLGY